MRTVAAVTAAAVALAGCSSKPREFTPRLTAPPADQAAFVQTYEGCKAEIAAGKRENFRDDRGTSAGVGVAIGTGAAVATAGAAASGAGMMSGVAAGAGLAAGLVVFAPLAIWGTSRAIRAGKEREIKAAMSLCLSERGHPVESWERVRR